MTGLAAEWPFKVPGIGKEIFEDLSKTAAETPPLALCSSTSWQTLRTRCFTHPEPGMGLGPRQAGEALSSLTPRTPRGPHRCRSCASPAGWPRPPRRRRSSGPSGRHRSCPRSSPGCAWRCTSVTEHPFPRLSGGSVGPRAVRCLSVPGFDEDPRLLNDKQLDDVCADLVQKIGVVRNHHQRGLRHRPQILREPFHGVFVLQGGHSPLPC